MPSKRAAARVEAEQNVARSARKELTEVVAAGDALNNPREVVLDGHLKPVTGKTAKQIVQSERQLQQAATKPPKPVRTLAPSATCDKDGVLLIDHTSEQILEKLA